MANILESTDAKLLRFQLDSLELHVRPHGSDSQTEFVYHKSPVDTYRNEDFYGVWHSGNITEIYYDAKESVELVNIKKALVALFQFRTEEGDYTEVHPNGECHVNYEKTTQMGSMKRLKRNCTLAENANTFIRPETALQVNIQSYRSADYDFVGDESIEQILARDYFRISMQGNDAIGGAVDSSIKLLRGGLVEVVSVATEENTKEFLSQLSHYKGDHLTTVLLNAPKTAEETNLRKVIGANMESLTPYSLGSAGSAKAFLDILPVMSTATKEELAKILDERKFKSIQVC